MRTRLNTQCVANVVSLMVSYELLFIVWANLFIYPKDNSQNTRMLSIHYVIDMMINRVQLMFYGNVKWHLRNDGKGFTYFQIQLLVWGGIMPYLLFCCIARSFLLQLFLIYNMISSIWSDIGISLCITIKVRWNISFCFVYVHFSSDILRCIFLS